MKHINKWTKTELTAKIKEIFPDGCSEFRKHYKTVDIEIRDTNTIDFNKLLVLSELLLNTKNINITGSGDQSYYDDYTSSKRIDIHCWDIEFEDD